MIETEEQLVKHVVEVQKTGKIPIITIGESMLPTVLPFRLMSCEPHTPVKELVVGEIYRFLYRPRSKQLLKRLVDKVDRGEGALLVFEGDNRTSTSDVTLFESYSTPTSEYHKYVPVPNIPISEKLVEELKEREK